VGWTASFPVYKLSALSIGLSPKCIPICHDGQIVVVFIRIQTGFSIAHKLFLTLGCETNCEGIPHLLHVLL
jgi:hypothetical protein